MLDLISCRATYTQCFPRGPTRLEALEDFSLPCVSQTLFLPAKGSTLCGMQTFQSKPAPMLLLPSHASKSPLHVKLQREPFQRSRRAVGEWAALHTITRAFPQGCPIPVDRLLPPPTSVPICRSACESQTGGSLYNLPVVPSAQPDATPPSSLPQVVPT